MLLKCTVSCLVTTGLQFGSNMEKGPSLPQCSGANAIATGWITVRTVGVNQVRLLGGRSLKSYFKMLNRFMDITIIRPISII